ncbi:hypothetical protein [Vallitalea sp.]|uniref:hypothetical protein n=1 Tax=Vallitalea sp. TaxID=1882829 RepID=UPI0025EC29EB|nr:hypothetical protein [Vallitalea sp.]MCT4687262.1 hypothetical protein [Vallitalea sp.]
MDNKKMIIAVKVLFVLCFILTCLFLIGLNMLKIQERYIVNGKFFGSGEDTYFMTNILNDNSLGEVNEILSFLTYDFYLDSEYEGKIIEKSECELGLEEGDVIRYKIQFQPNVNTFDPDKLYEFQVSKDEKSLLSILLEKSGL